MREGNYKLGSTPAITDFYSLMKLNCGVSAVEEARTGNRIKPGLRLQSVEVGRQGTVMIEILGRINGRTNGQTQ